MSRDISEIPGLSGKTLVLFRASGFVNVGSLLERPAADITRVLAHTNGEYGIVGWLPSPGAVGAWISTARLLENAGTEEDSGPMTAEALAEVRESAVMVARPVLGTELKEAGVALDAVPIARFVGDAPKSLLSGGGVTHFQVGASKRRERRERRAAARSEESTKPAMEEQGDGGLAYQEVLVPEDRRPNVSREDDQEAPIAEERRESEPSSAGDLHFRDTESLALLSKHSERRNNGMTHKTPALARMSAIVTVVTLTIAWVGGLIGIGLAVYFAMVAGQMPQWLLWFLPVVPICLILYGTLGLRARCRLCGYQLFAHKTCTKHEKAHHSLLGSIFATAMRLIIRGTWRCMYCGTKQKLK